MPDPSAIQRALAALKQKIHPSKPVTTGEYYPPRQIQKVPESEYTKPVDTRPPTGQANPQEQLHPEVQRYEDQYQEVLRNADAHKAQLEGRSWVNMPGVDVAMKYADAQPVGTRSEEFAKAHPNVKAAVAWLTKGGASKDTKVGTEETAVRAYGGVQSGVDSLKPVNPALSLPGALASAVAADDRRRRAELALRLREEEIRRLSTPPSEVIELDEPPTRREGVTKRD